MMIYSNTNVLRLLLLATLALGLTGVATLAGGGVADAQQRSRTTAMRAANAPSTPGASPEGVVNINSAAEQELTRLPGIGPSKAAAIVAYRARGRRFLRVEDLLRVRGIGRATFRRLRPMLSVEGPTTLGGTAASGH